MQKELIAKIINKYVNILDPFVEKDRYALGWWNAFIAYREMLLNQDCDISEKQIAHLRRSILGGMGSFHDWDLDTKLFGEKAIEAQKQLKEVNSELHEALR